MDLWPVDKNWTDTTVVLKDEMLTKAITGRDFYIRGRLFLWSTHTVVENQKDSFMISYNPENLYTQEDGKRIYNLYLRAIARIEVGEGEELPKGQQLNQVNAFSVEEFYNMVSALEEEKGSNTFSIAINYASAFNKDTTACIWDRTEPIEYKINSRTE